MHPRRAAALALVTLLLLVPGASAIPDPTGPISITYPDDASPMMLGAGSLTVSGQAAAMLITAKLQETRLGPLPSLHAIGGDRDHGFTNATYTNVTLVIHQATTLVAIASEPAALPLRVTADYGLLVVLPGGKGNETSGTPDGQSSEGDDRPDHVPPAPAPKLMLLGTALAGSLSWPEGPEATLVLGEATVSIVDETGAPLAGWDRRVVNPKNDGAGSYMMFTATGPFKGDVRAQTVALAPSPKDGFAEAMDLLKGLGSLVDETGETGSGPKGGDSEGMPDLSSFSLFSNTLNGALLIMAEGLGEDGTTTAPQEAKFGDETAQLGAITVLRGGPLTFTWSGNTFRVQGEPTLAFTGTGFVTAPTTTVGPVPLVSALLWVGAVGAIVFFFVRKPEAGELPRKMRLIALAVHLVALVAAFVVWDMMFAETFGMSLLTNLGAAGGDGTALAGLGAIAALQLIPWFVALVLFAIPVRILLGVGLRYALKGKGGKGFAKAGGLVALAVATPLYALWVLNGIVGFAQGFLPASAP